MRDIKFRAYEKPDKKFNFNGAMHYDIVGNDYFGKWLASDDYEIMQYTELKDKNGKEIYEGDIVKHYKQGDFSSNEPITGKVVISPTSGTLVDNWPINIWNCEVIGNIYENNSLLPKEEI